MEPIDRNAITNPPSFLKADEKQFTEVGLEEVDRLLQIIQNARKDSPQAKQALNEFIRLAEVGYRKYFELQIERERDLDPEAMKTTSDFQSSKLLKEWAEIKNNLAIAYICRVQGDNAQNIEKAIEACTEALTVYSLEKFPYEWAKTQQILAIAYRDRLQGDKAENLKRSISAYESALTVYTAESFPGERRETLKILTSAQAFESQSLPHSFSETIWERGNKLLVFVAGGASLGGLLGQLPGAIIGGAIAAIYTIFTQPREADHESS